MLFFYYPDKDTYMYRTNKLQPSHLFLDVTWQTMLPWSISPLSMLYSHLVWWCSIDYFCLANTIIVQCREIKNYFHHDYQRSYWRPPSLYKWWSTLSSHWSMFPLAQQLNENSKYILLTLLGLSNFHLVSLACHNTVDNLPACRCRETFSTQVASSSLRKTFLSDGGWLCFNLGQ